jgi:hypothetical protein
MSRVRPDLQSSRDPIARGSKKTWLPNGQWHGHAHPASRRKLGNLDGVRMDSSGIFSYIGWSLCTFRRNHFLIILFSQLMKKFWIAPALGLLCLLLVSGCREEAVATCEEHTLSPCTTDPAMVNIRVNNMSEYTLCNVEVGPGESTTVQPRHRGAACHHLLPCDADRLPEFLRAFYGRRQRTCRAAL